MSWKSVRCITAVSVIGLMWLVLPAVEAQSSGLFSAVHRASAQLNSPVPASLDATTVRRRVVTIDLGRLQRAQATVAGLRRPPVPVKAVSPRSGGRGAVPASDATLTLNLFEDVVFTGIVERRLVAQCFRFVAHRVPDRVRPRRVAHLDPRLPCSDEHRRRHLGQLHARWGLLSGQS